MSPLIDEELLEEIRKRESPIYFAREYLAEWTEAIGAYFTQSEIEENIADYSMIDPAMARGQMVGGGVDWGFSVDANVLCLVGCSADGDANARRHGRRPVFFVAHVEAHHRMLYDDFVKRIVDVGDPERGGFRIRVLAAETNLVGDMPVQELTALAHRRRTGIGVQPVFTDNRRKQSMFGGVKLLLQQGRLVLPRHPELLKQLAALEFELSDAGNMKISVPERVGHDDIAMALGQAVSTLASHVEHARVFDGGRGDVLTTGKGTAIFERPACVNETWLFGMRGHGRNDW
jgi:hypothetical protein